MANIAFFSTKTNPTVKNFGWIQPKRYATTTYLTATKYKVTLKKQINAKFRSILTAKEMLNFEPESGRSKNPEK